MAGCFEDGCGIRINVSNGSYVPEILLNAAGGLECTGAGLNVNLLDPNALNPNAFESCSNILHIDTTGNLWAAVPSGYGMNVVGEHQSVPHSEVSNPPNGDWSDPSVDFSFTNPFDCSALIFIEGSMTLNYGVYHGTIGGVNFTDGSINALDPNYGTGTLGGNIIAYNANLKAQLLINTVSHTVGRFDIGGVIPDIGAEQFKKQTEKFNHLFAVGASASVNIVDQCQHEGVNQRMNVATATGSPGNNRGFQTVLNIAILPLGISNIPNGNVTLVTTGTATGGLGTV